MRDDIKALIQKRRYCVLATASENKPYCSLMAYTPSKDGTRLFMATHRNTRKFRNMKKNPVVSLLIDSRDLTEAQALTVEGEFEEIQNETEKKKILDMLLNDHPQLNDFVDHPDAAFICINASSLVFLNGLTDPYYETID